MLEVAQNDIQRWLDAKRIPEKKRATMAAMIENMVDAVVNGQLTVDEDGSLVQILQFPESGVDKLTYKLRISSHDLEGPKRLVKGDGLDDNLLRILMALTGAPVNTLRKLDLSVDKPLADSIATFFL